MSAVAAAKGRDQDEARAEDRRLGPGRRPMDRRAGARQEVVGLGDSMTVIPMNRIPRSTAMIDRVSAALRASGGLNAGTPSAIASTPVRATERRRRTP